MVISIISRLIKGVLMLRATLSIDANESVLSVYANESILSIEE